ncbi:MAG TPA: S8 family peptidase [Candidatus Polarisedimenticolia bacterium]|nr:S8 family peptidase [Candidatus Polarisedimenticolia bacterium]
MAIILALVLILSGGIFDWASWPAAQAAESSDDSRLSPRLIKLLEALEPDDMVPVIVSTTEPSDEADDAAAQLLGVRAGRRFSQLGAYSASVPAGSLRSLSRGRNVRHVSYDFIVRSFNDLNYVTVGADQAARQTTPLGSSLNGAGVTVAVVDSGIANHSDIGSRQVAEVEVVGHEKGFADYYGHGTHVAGIIAGDGSASSDSQSFRRFNGIAPKAKLVSVRVLGPDGSGRVSDVLAGINWVVLNRSAYNIRVMNLSLGHSVEQSYVDDPLCQAVELAWRSGIVVVAAAGNSGTGGYATIHSPGNDPSIITVGASNNYRSAVRPDDVLTSYTSRGPTYLDHVVKPDLVAPGNRTISLRAEGSALDTAYAALRVKQGAYRSDPAAAQLDSPYFELSGSSMSAGVVSGMAALMIQAQPLITPDTVKARLMKGAEKRLGYDVFSEGAGFADLITALGLADVALLPALSPKATWTETGILFQDPGTLWGDAAVWGGDVIWGSDPQRGTGAVWGDATVWGRRAAASSSGSVAPGNAGASSIVWGGGMRADSIVWGGGMRADSIVWGGGMRADSIVWGGGMSADSIVWGGGMSADSIVWGGGMSADSIVWGGGISADSIVWGGGFSLFGESTLLGDDLPSNL